MGTGGFYCSKVTRDGGNKGTLPALMKPTPGETLGRLFWCKVSSEFFAHRIFKGLGFDYPDSQGYCFPTEWGLTTLIHVLKIQTGLRYKFTWYARSALLTLNVKGLHHVVIDKLKVFMADPVLDIPFPPCEEVIHHSHLVAVHHQLVGEVGTDKASPTSNLAQIKANKQTRKCFKKKKRERGGNYQHTFIKARMIFEKKKVIPKFFCDPSLKEISLVGTSGKNWGKEKKDSFSDKDFLLFTWLNEKILKRTSWRVYEKEDAHLCSRSRIFSLRGATA